MFTRLESRAAVRLNPWRTIPKMETQANELAEDISGFSARARLNEEETITRGAEKVWTRP